MGTLGWNVIKVANGHDLQGVYSTVEKAVAIARIDPTRPVCIWLKTIKGYGVKSTMENSAGGHGFPLANGEKIVEFVDEIYSGQTPDEFKQWALALRKDWEQKEEAKKAKAAAAAANPAPAAPAVKKDKVQAGLSAGAVKAAMEGLPVYSVSSDVQGSTGISGFQKATDRFVEVGQLQQEVAAELFFRFGEGAVGEDSVTVPQTHANRCFRRLQGSGRNELLPSMQLMTKFD